MPSPIVAYRLLPRETVAVALWALALMVDRERGNRDLSRSLASGDLSTLAEFVADVVDIETVVAMAPPSVQEAHGE
ncbi:MAG TPA: hypothetical protein DCQ64_23945 [Candidatus Rokubacteria bacterium]|nr:hypothetical protein [Candidatus Rokubacteria bacterium]